MRLPIEIRLVQRGDRTHAHARPQGHVKLSGPAADADKTSVMAANLLAEKLLADIRNNIARALGHLADLRATFAPNPYQAKLADNLDRQLREAMDFSRGYQLDELKFPQREKPKDKTP